MLTQGGCSLEFALSMSRMEGHLVRRILTG